MFVQICLLEYSLASYLDKSLWSPSNDTCPLWSVTSQLSHQEEMGFGFPRILIHFRFSLRGGLWRWDQGCFHSISITQFFVSSSYVNPINLTILWWWREARSATSVSRSCFLISNRHPTWYTWQQLSLHAICLQVSHQNFLAPRFYH